MTPQAAIEHQMDCYRRMTCQERLEIGLRLHELACDLAREGIRRQFPNASEDEVDLHLRRRLEMSRR